MTIQGISTSSWLLLTERQFNHPQDCYKDIELTPFELMLFELTPFELTLFELADVQCTPCKALGHQLQL